MLTATGKDATDDFEDVGHSDDAREMMKKYYVGEIDRSTLPVERKYTPPATPPPAGNQGSGNLSKILQFLLPLLWKRTLELPVDFLFHFLFPLEKKF